MRELWRTFVDNIRRRWFELTRPIDEHDPVNRRVQDIAPYLR